MESFLERCVNVFVETVPYVQCHVARLLVNLWFYWKTPQPLPPADDTLLLRSATSLAAAIRRGEVKSADLVSACIKRTRQVQPIINAVVEDRFKEALREAKAADRLVASRKKSVQELSRQKPLLGLPFSVKDGIAVKGMLLDAGLLAYRGRRAVEDAPTVARMRAAGAIPFALTNVAELCVWGDADNLIHGITHNPHDTRRGPGGSCGGEGSLLASAGSIIGLGTDMGGSLRIPAAYCGIFGHKPTAGAVPTTGLLPDFGDNMAEYNCVGPMTRFAEDLPLLLEVLVGGSANTLRLDEQVNLEGLKVFFTETEGCTFFSRVTAEARQAVGEVTRWLKEAVGSNVSSLHVPDLPQAMMMWYRVCAAKYPQSLAANAVNVFVDPLRAVEGMERHTAAMLVASNTAARSRCSSRQQAEQFMAYVEAERDRLEETLGEDGVLILPAAPSEAPYRNQDGFFPASPAMTVLFSIFKMPATVCPVMRSANGLPLAVQVVAKRGNDRLCLTVARELEWYFGGCIQPAVGN